MMPLHANVIFKLRLMLFVGHQRRIAGSRRLLIRRVVVSTALILMSRIAEVVALEKGIGEQVVRRCSFTVIGERAEELPIPTRSFLIIRRLLRGLCLRMIIRGKILHVGFQFSNDQRSVGWLSSDPERRP